MTKDIDTFMDSLYQQGKISVDKEKVSILNIFLQRAFPHVDKRAISDASALLAVYCGLLVDGKHISVNGTDMDAGAFGKLFDNYAKKAEGEFDSNEAKYDIYVSALVVALFVYRYTDGLTNKDLMFAKTKGGDYSERISSAIDE